MAVLKSLLTPAELKQLRPSVELKVKTALQALPATREYAAAALAGNAKRGWYAASGAAIRARFGPDASRFAALLASMSPRTSVAMNFHNALRTFVNWDAEGRPSDRAAIVAIMERSSLKSQVSKGKSNVLGAWVNNAVRSLTATDFDALTLSGPKVHSFFKNLTGDAASVTLDSWMATFSGIAQTKLSGNLNGSGPGKSASYLALSARVRDAAALLTRLTRQPWSAAEVQETVWTFAKVSWELAQSVDRTIPDLVKSGEVTDERIASAPDFTALFARPEHVEFLAGTRYACDHGSVSDTLAYGKLARSAYRVLSSKLTAAARRLETARQGRKVTEADEDVPF
jgi:hypothetical protein